MKKIIFFLLILSVTAQSQSNFSLQIGGVSSSIKSDTDAPYLKYSPILGLGINGVLRYKVNKINLVFEPGYIGKGASIKFDQVNTKLRLNYLSLPVSVEIPVSKNVNVGFGFEFSYLADIKYSDQKIKDLFDDFNNPTSGLVSALLNASKRTSVLLRYSYGINTIYSDRNYKLKNNYLLFDLRYKLKNG